MGWLYLKADPILQTISFLNILHRHTHTHAHTHTHTITNTTNRRREILMVLYTCHLQYLQTKQFAFPWFGAAGH